MKKNYTLYLFLIISISSFSQRETDNWYFGTEAALKFNYNNPPTALTDSEMTSFYGSSSISSIDGELLFYTTGSFVYNKKHYKMENGDLLASDTEVLQTSVIIPKPNSNNIYYLITLKNSNVPSKLGPLIPSGLYYSIIDMSLNDGLGKVIEKNFLLTPLASEKLAAVHAKDGKSLWIISFGKKTTDDIKFNNVFSYKIDENGVSNTAIESNFPFDVLNNVGALKASPNGRFLAFSNFTNVVLSEFNTESGKITTSKFLNVAQLEGMQAIDSKPNTYGLEFSQDSKYLYVETIEKGQNIIFQYNTSDINNKQKLHTSSNSKSYMQLAKDGNIYITTAENELIGGDYLNQIIPPKSSKESIATYNSNAIYLLGKKSRLGLPNFIQSYFRTRIITENGCLNNFTNFEIDTYADITAANWHFGDGNTSSEIKPTHLYKSPGLYTVTCTITINNRNIFVSKEIEVYTPSNFSIDNKNIIQCDVNNDGTDFFNLTDIINNINNSDLISKIGFYDSYNNAENDINEILNPTNYLISGKKEIFLRIYDENGCYVLESFFVESKFVELGNIQNFYTCYVLKNLNDDVGEFDLNLKRLEIKNNLNLNNDVSLKFFPDSYSAQVNQNELDDIYISKSSTIWVKALTSLGCGGIEPFNLIVNPEPIINLEDSYTICFDTSIKPPVIISADTSNDSYEWKDSNNNVISTNKDFTLNAIGNYSLTVYKLENNILCSNTKNFKVINPDVPVFSLITANTEDNTNNTIEVIIDGNSTYEFSLDKTNFFGNSTSYTFTNVNPGLRTVYIRDINNCEEPVSANIPVIGFNKFFTPNGDGLNDYWQVHGLDAQFFKSVDIIIFDRYGKIVNRITDFSSKGWDGTFNGNLLSSNSYWFKAKLIDIDDKIIQESGSFALIRK